MNPVAETGGTFVFSEADGRRRLERFLDLLRHRAEVREFVLSFDDQPTRLTEIRDVLRFGRSAAPAHLDLARRVALRLRRGDRLWLCASAYSDRHLGDGSGPYARELLRGLPALPPGVGIVWTGPEVISPEITAEGLARTRERLGGREIFLYDNYPVNDDRGDALALVLGPLRRRDPALAAVAASYLSCPMTQLGASRLPLATVADWLSDPAGYDPERSWRRAIRSLSGADPEVGRAVETQALEWGGWVGERTWRHRDRANPESAAQGLEDPAAVASWTWIVERYPERVRLVERADDEAFRVDVVRIMHRRLAVARGVPLAVEYLARTRASRVDAAAPLAVLRALRAELAVRPDALASLDRFLEAAGVPSASP